MPNRKHTNASRLLPLHPESSQPRVNRYAWGIDISIANPPSHLALAALPPNRSRRRKRGKKGNAEVCSKQKEKTCIQRSESAVTSTADSPSRRRLSSSRSSSPSLNEPSSWSYSSYRYRVSASPPSFPHHPSSLFSPHYRTSNSEPVPGPTSSARGSSPQSAKSSYRPSN